jgi:hypothetical protein
LAAEAFDDATGVRLGIGQRGCAALAGCFGGCVDGHADGGDDQDDEDEQCAVHGVQHTDRKQL